MLEYQFDAQLLIEGENLSEDEIGAYIRKHFEGDCLLIGSKLHFHTNQPGQMPDYCATLGKIYDIVVENMGRQARGLQG